MTELNELFAWIRNFAYNKDYYQNEFESERQ